jgi:histidinol dehydrogenase
MKRKAFFRKEAAAQVEKIVFAVQKEGDAALCRFTREFDGADLSPEELPVTQEEIRAAYRQVGEDFLSALTLARERITSFHQKQLARSWFETDQQGVFRGQVVRPLSRVGVYVPGGTASYPSSVLMNAIPAAVAGVSEIVLVTPPGPDGRINPHTLVAAGEAGVTEIYRVGGAQAVAALAFGTETIKAVDKITGPGNIYVTLAKRWVFGQVDIDMLAGPSEVAVVADESASPAYIAADLLAQAEHDPLSAAILFTPSAPLAEAVQKELARQLASLPRRETAGRALAGGGALVITRDLEEAVELADAFAPEHFELLVAEPFLWLGRIKNAGAIFLGAYSPEPVGDYLAGPNHVLPTGGTARWASGLGVDAFLKRINVVAYSREALAQTGRQVAVLARAEGLEAHARAVEVRLAREMEGRC